ncbi:MAG TPA: hypothetical protein VHE55_02260 [Fimbriimonadaceae bacterium]|nr:hypothetical protein [Fimbriimonadaceae bacterium]
MLRVSRGGGVFGTMKLRNLLALLALCLAGGALAQTPDQTVQKFAELLTKRDLDGAAKLVKNGHVAQVLRDEAKQTKEWPTLTLSNFSDKVEGGITKVTFTIHADGIEGITDHQETLSLAKSGTDWLIVPPGDRNAGGPQSLLPGVAYLLGNPSAFPSAKVTAKSTSCLSNIKQLALATIMFASDYDDVLKTTAAKWSTSIYPYTKNKTILTCPEDKPGTVSYSFNGRLANVSMSKIKNPATTVLAYEGKGEKLNFRHEGRAAVAFADGHAKLITKEQAKTLVWKP